jgi:hypothetical protein
MRVSRHTLQEINDKLFLIIVNLEIQGRDVTRLLFTAMEPHYYAYCKHQTDRYIGIEER